MQGLDVSVLEGSRILGLGRGEIIGLMEGLVNCFSEHFPRRARAAGPNFFGSLTLEGRHFSAFGCPRVCLGPRLLGSVQWL